MDLSLIYIVLKMAGHLRYQLEMSGLRSEHISNRLFFFMLVIILSLLFMAVPLVVGSYQDYIKTRQA